MLFNYHHKFKVSWAHFNTYKRNFNGKLFMNTFSTRVFKGIQGYSTVYRGINIDYFIGSAPYGFLFTSCKTLENERVSLSKFCNE